MSRHDRQRHSNHEQPLSPFLPIHQLKSDEQLEKAEATKTNSLILILESFVKKHAVFLIGITLFVLLLYHNPFSVHTHIANLEPFPDTIYYVGGALGLLDGHGFVLYRLGQTINEAVPPLYSLTLLPFFALYRDVRMFYYANATLALIAAVTFYWIVDRLFKNQKIKMLVFLLYVSSFLIYFYPTYALSENVVMPVFLFVVVALIRKVSWKMTALMSLLCIALYAAKYVNLPLIGVLLGLYSLKIWLEKTNMKLRLQSFVQLIGCGVLFYLWYITLNTLIAGKSVT